MTDPSPEFRFECTQCGACCRRPGEVRFDDDTFVAMADAKGMSVEDFRVAHDVRHTDGRKEQWSFVVGDSDACPMLGPNDLCTVHHARPRQCRTYPFWPETTSAAAWNAEAQHCPGIGRGPAWPNDIVEALVEREAEGSDPF